jgi:hypothetical protein
MAHRTPLTLSASELPAADAAGIYRQRTAHFAAAAARESRRSRALAHARLLVFLIAVIAIAAAIGAERGTSRILIAAVGALLVGVFIAFAALHAGVRRRGARYDALREVNEEGPHRVARSWNAIPTHNVLNAGADHPYARDLDVGGHASVFQLLGPVGTAAGVQRIREWLLSPAPADIIRERQIAVAELAELRDLRDALAAQRLLHRRTTALELQRFMEWAESPPALGGSAPVVLAWVLPTLTLGALLLRFGGVVTGALWLLPLAISVLVVALRGARWRDTLERAASREGPLRHAAAAFELLEHAELQAPLLRRLRDTLTAPEHDALRAARRLERITHLAELRYSPMMHFTVQLLTLWDLHIVLRLDRWRRQSGHRAREWLWALGDIEALAALATIRHDNPDWSFPELLEQGEPRLEARALGHPLIPAGTRVGNDVDVGPPGSFLLVTGSNMSGKSTLLRAIGLNAVLAQAGAPVCASEMRLSPLHVHTSMRVEDSLEQGVSFFMAELLRLRAVVNGARAAGEAGGAAILYLLDEILQGTNTAERQVAARRIIRELLELPAIGAVTSHDLSLADSEPLRSSSVPVHFTESVERTDGVPRMTFDYRLRPGLATSVNALTLMEMIGLAPTDEDIRAAARDGKA